MGQRAFAHGERFSHGRKTIFTAFFYSARGLAWLKSVNLREWLMNGNLDRAMPSHEAVVADGHIPPAKTGCGNPD
jgi:hypothetical protein